MKKVVPLFLLCVFLFNTVGYYIAYKAVQFSVKKEIKSQIKSNLLATELTAITINKTDITSIEWKKSGEEIFYKDELYDIVRSTETATTITYYCINDKKEKTLFANLDEHVKMYVTADQPLKNSSAKKLVNHVVKLYFSNEQLFAFNNMKNENLYPSFIQISYTPAFIETSSPPPEFV